MKVLTTWRLSRRSLCYLVISSYTVLISCLLLSLGEYPGTYSVLVNAVSNLGDPILNPWPGWFFFSTGMCTFGFLAIFIVMTLHYWMSRVEGKWSRGYLWAAIIGNAGCAGVGIFSEAETTFTAHAIAAGLFFGGLLLSAALAWPFMFKRAVLSTRANERVARVAVLVVMMAMVSLSFIMLFLASTHGLVSGITASGLFSMVFWEWMLVISLNIQQLFLVALCLPSTA
jgi:hypothetical protein